MVDRPHDEPLDKSSGKSPERTAAAEAVDSFMDNQPIDAIILYLETRGLRRRAEQSAAMGLGPTGPIQIAQWLKGQGMTLDSVEKALRNMNATIRSVGTQWIVEAKGER